MSDDTLTRRSFLRGVATSAAACWTISAGIVTLAGCGGADEGTTQQDKDAPGMARNAIDKAQEVATPCSDPSQLSDEAVQTRKTFEYQIHASDPNKTCKMCNFWQPPTDEGPCGTCTLVKGPINPTGTCKSWVEKLKA